MPQRTVIVASQVGLHARPASAFTRTALKSGLPVSIARAGDRPVDAASILQVMSMAVKHGEQVVVSAEGPGAERVLDDLVAVLSTDFDAEQ
ncbi:MULTISPECIES: HPr family phosphocarrier protein [Streptomyces]|uniref:HPr family phosphocarrier protein n=1 Tax=Streptomyces lycopersici TaxID=2974589 RepID=UPI0021CE6464|nr:HPr family phosphocarrier protein [Streptomyces sp. NEAU-383]